jgi:DNA-binding beta-propeller fold protein YncE
MKSSNRVILTFKIFALIAVSILLLSGCSAVPQRYARLEKMRTFAGVTRGEKGAPIREPFGLAFDKLGNLFISDGEAGKIWQADAAGTLKLVTDKLDTPSALAFDKHGSLYVADSGSNTIKKINTASGEVSIVAGVANKQGYLDGSAAAALFNAPIGLAIDDRGKIYVADTYNDRIRVIENGNVSTFAGGKQGFADADAGLAAQFDTPCGIALDTEGNLLVADTGNGRVRSIDMTGKVSTIAGGGQNEGLFSLPGDVALAGPLDVKVDANGVIYIADNSKIYVMGRRVIMLVEKLNPGRGFADGDARAAKLNRPSGMAFDAAGNLYIADSDNQLVRVLENKEDSIGAEFKSEDIVNMRPTAEEMRAAAPARWPYDPPERAREIAGTLGEIRGERKDEATSIWFHNGLDVVGGYGETARFVRSEKVLWPLATAAFNTLRENLRLPTLGYIHIRLGRDQSDKAFPDVRFQWSHDDSGTLSGVRIPRGTKFQAGEAIGTLNAMNHVHLIAGRPGYEMNALSALDLPGVKDTIAPVIENVAVYNENWQPVDARSETKTSSARINLAGKVHIVAKCYDRMDGNADRRRLGVYRVGYQILREDGTPVEGFEEPRTSIRFDKLPEYFSNGPRLVYAIGSKSGATGETIFNYNVTNFAQHGEAHEGAFDTGTIPPGNYILRVFAADFFDNLVNKDIRIGIGN